MTLTHPDPLTPVSFLHLRSELKFLPYHGISCLHPTLQALVSDRDIHRVAAGLPTPGISESHRINIAVEAEMKRAGGRGSNGGGGRVKIGGNSCAWSDQTAKTVEASGVVSQGWKGTPLTNSAHISILTLRAGENTHDVLRNVAIPTLGVSVWCKCWHHGGRCFSGCDRRGSNIPPTAAALATVTAYLKIERALG